MIGLLTAVHAYERSWRHSIFHEKTNLTSWAGRGLLPRRPLPAKPVR